MKLTLRHRIPVVIGAAVLMTGASGAAAFALVAAQTEDAGIDAGNTQPTDDNRPSPASVAEPGDERGLDATAEPSEPEAEHPRPAATARHQREGEVEPGDDASAAATTRDDSSDRAAERGDDRGADAEGDDHRVANDDSPDANDDSGGGHSNDG